VEKHRQITGKKKQLDEEAAKMLTIKRCLLFWLQPRKKPNPLQSDSPFFPLLFLFMNVIITVLPSNFIFSKSKNNQD